MTCATDSLRSDKVNLQCRWHESLLQNGFNADTPGKDTRKDTRVDELTNLLQLRDKERRAIQTIFEKKIAVLIDSVVNNLDTIDVPPTPTKAALKDLTALRKLVRASVDALKQADQEGYTARP